MIVSLFFLYGVVQINTGSHEGKIMDIDRENIGRKKFAWPERPKVGSLAEEEAVALPVPINAAQRVADVDIFRP